jgi:hypothetical protein
VAKAGQGELGGPDRAADGGIGLEHEHPQPRARQHRGGDEAVLAGPDDDDIWISAHQVDGRW